MGSKFSRSGWEEDEEEEDGVSEGEAGGGNFKVECFVELAIEESEIDGGRREGTEDLRGWRPISAMLGF